MSDDLRDLIGRYASGSLSEEEQKRLFEAALEDQDLFDELAREQGIRQLLAEPGVRERLIGALQPPKRTTAWFLAAAAGVAAAALIFVLMRPSPKPPIQIAAVTAPPPAPAVPTPPKEKATGAALETRAAAPQTSRDSLSTQPMKKAAVPDAPGGTAGGTVASLAEPQNAPVAPQRTAAAQNMVGLALGPAAGFHFSLETAGHLIVRPSTAGYLSVRTGEGVVLYPSQPSAAGSMVDVPLPDDAASVIVTFSDRPDPVALKPVPRAEASGDIRAPGSSVIELKIPR